MAELALPFESFLLPEFFPKTVQDLDEALTNAAQEEEMENPHAATDVTQGSAPPKE